MVRLHLISFDLGNNFKPKKGSPVVINASRILWVTSKTDSREKENAYINFGGNVTLDVWESLEEVHNIIKYQNEEE
jgi:hypothetical protein